MRFIIHIDDPESEEDGAFALRCIRQSIENKYDTGCAYRRGKMSSYVYKTKTGWTARLTHGR